MYCSTRSRLAAKAASWLKLLTLPNGGEVGLGVQGGAQHLQRGPELVGAEVVEPGLGGGGAQDRLGAEFDLLGHRGGLFHHLHDLGGQLRLGQVVDANGGGAVVHPGQVSVAVRARAALGSVGGAVASRHAPTRTGDRMDR